MKYYYYAENNEQFGPYTIDEIKAKRIKRSTLVWTEGMDDWKRADTIVEIKKVLGPEPPPIPKNPKYDYSYKGDLGGTISAAILFVILLFIYLVGIYFNEEEIEEFIIWYSFLCIIIGIGIIIQVINIARRQNRNRIAWGLFAFFLPFPALFIIGLLKKLNN